MLNMRVAWTILLFQLSCSALKSSSLLDIDTIEESRLSITLDNGTKTLGLQNALDRRWPYRFLDNTVGLFPLACDQIDGTQNCTAACQDNSMFISLRTLHNCAVLPEISVRLANDTLTANARGLAEKLNIVPSNNTSSLPSIVSNKIQTCLIDLCTTDDNCNKALNRTTSNRNTHYTGASFVGNGDYFRLCLPIPAYVDADVGGIGVFISYVMEMGLALVAFVLTIPWVSIAKGLRASFVYCLHALPPKRGSRKSIQSTQTTSSKNNQEYFKDLRSALVDFQKAQCWFMLATNIAGLIVEKSGGLEPESLQQLYNTYVFIKVIAIGGFLPITFSLFNLHMIRELAWYPITLSIVTITVAITTLKVGHASFTPTTADFGSITDQVSQGSKDSCGKRNLIPLCYYPRKGDNFGFNASSSGSSANVILAFCLVTLAIILIDHFCRSDDSTQQKLNRWILQKLGVDPTKALFPHAGTVLRYGTPAFHFVFFWLYIYCFVLFSLDLNWFRENDVYDPGWGFGQIVAVVVWLPMLIDYAFKIAGDHFRGIEKDSEHRSPKLYEVVKKVQRNQKMKAESGQESEMELLNLPYHNLRDGDSR